MSQYTAAVSRSPEARVLRRPVPVETDRRPSYLCAKPPPVHEPELLAAQLPATCQVFCDWLTLRARLLAPVPRLNDGCVVFIDADGQLRYTVDRAFKHEGSYDTSVQLRCFGDEVQLSGNVGRWSRPENICGASVGDCIEIARRLMAEKTGADLALAVIEFTRVDLTTMLQAGCPEYRQRVLHVLSTRRPGHIQRPSVYVGQTVKWPSARRQVTLYDKAAELRKHSKWNHLFPHWLEHLDAAGALRFEVRLLADWLRRRELRESGNWSRDTARGILTEAMEDLGMTKPIHHEQKPALSWRDRMAWESWTRGEDTWSELLATYSKRTAYRIRSEVRKATGDDITRPLQLSSAQAGADVPIVLEPYAPSTDYAFQHELLSANDNARITAECHGFAPDGRADAPICRDLFPGSRRSRRR